MFLQGIPPRLALPVWTDQQHVGLFRDSFDNHAVEARKGWVAPQEAFLGPILGEGVFLFTSVSPPSREAVVGFVGKGIDRRRWATNLDGLNCPP